MRPLLLLLIFSMPLLGQLPPEIDRTYDKFKDETLITLRMSFKSVLAVIAARHSGKELKTDIDHMTLGFSGKCGSVFCFTDTTKVIFLVNGQSRFHFNQPRYSPVRSDTVAYTIARENLRDFMDAHTLETQIGRFEITWNAKDITLLKTMFEITGRP